VSGSNSLASLVFKKATLCGDNLVQVTSRTLRAMQHVWALGAGVWWANLEASVFKKGIPEHIKGCYPNPVRPTSVSFIFVFVEMDTMLACFGAGDAKFQDQLGSIGKPKNVFLSNFNQTNPVIANETKNSALKWRIPTLGGSWVIRKQFDRNITINPENTYSTGYMMRYWIYIYIHVYVYIYIHITFTTVMLLRVCEDWDPVMIAKDGSGTYWEWELQGRGLEHLGWPQCLVEKGGETKNWIGVFFNGDDMCINEHHHHLDKWRHWLTSRQKRGFIAWGRYRQFGQIGEWSWLNHWRGLQQCPVDPCWLLDPKSDRIVAWWYLYNSI